MARTYTIVRCKVDCEPEVAIVERSIRSLQEEVGGYLISYPVRSVNGQGIIILCDEDGGLKGSDPNPHKPRFIVGNFIFIGMKGDDWESLTDEQILFIKEYLQEEIIDERELD